MTITAAQDACGKNPLESRRKRIGTFDAAGQPGAFSRPILAEAEPLGMIPEWNENGTILHQNPVGLLNCLGLGLHDAS
jgi:hypothetical protein